MIQSSSAQSSGECFPQISAQAVALLLDEARQAVTARNFEAVVRTLEAASAQLEATSAQMNEPAFPHSATA
jgi:hypothetical protein